MADKKAHKSCTIRGPYKGAFIAALRQAKFYLPWQAAAAAAHLLQRRSTQDAVHELECSTRDTFLSLLYCSRYVYGFFGHSTRAAVHE